MAPRPAFLSSLGSRPRNIPTGLKPPTQMDRDRENRQLPDTSRPAFLSGLGGGVPTGLTPPSQRGSSSFVSRTPSVDEMEPGEKKARFGEVTDYNDMVTNKLKAGLGKLFGPAPDDLFRRPVRRILNDDRPTRRTFGDGTKPVLDSKGNIVKNLRQKAKQGGQFQEVDVIDLTTEMVIDE